MKLKELIFKSANHRDTLLALVTKLRALLPTLNEDYMMISTRLFLNQTSPTAIR
ncbi:hypothetical protein COXBURSA331_A0465 [Coxiella burnetii RSA 331]|nr:hypothetical protein COXBURSA331_A0465 [Coxiella burnetii RSA 331]